MHRCWQGKTEDVGRAWAPGCMPSLWEFTPSVAVPFSSCNHQAQAVVADFATDDKSSRVVVDLSTSMVAACTAMRICEIQVVAIAGIDSQTPTPILAVATSGACPQRNREWGVVRRGQSHDAMGWGGYRTTGMRKPPDPLPPPPRPPSSPRFAVHLQTSPEAT